MLSLPDFPAVPGPVHNMLVEMGVLQGNADLMAKILWAALHGVIVLHLGAAWPK
jgi:hypothetical protein